MIKHRKIGLQRVSLTALGQELQNATKGLFISDVTFLTGKANICALAIFGGEVAVFDPSTKTMVREYSEHKKRVWQVVNIAQISLRAVPMTEQ